MLITRDLVWMAIHSATKRLDDRVGTIEDCVRLVPTCIGGKWGILASIEPTEIYTFEKIKTEICKSLSLSCDDGDWKFGYVKDEEREFVPFFYDECVD